MTDQQLVKALFDMKADLSEWELSFAESIAKWVDGGKSLTEKQKAKVLDIISDEV